MTDQWNSRSGVHDAPTPDAGPDSSARARSGAGDRWRRPRRSTGDRKIAGVAGGLGGALGVDPILLRVGFVVLTIFGGFGGLLYVLGWLLLPADGDEVSAAQALLGRGRSSVPPTLAVGLGVVAVISTFSMFSWGLPFLPLAVGGVVVMTVLHRRGHAQRRSGRGHYDWHGRDWDRSDAGADWTTRTDARVRAFTEQAQRWGERAQQWGEQWGGQPQRRREQQRPSGCGPRARSPHRDHRDRRYDGVDRPGSASSPFDRPPFWEASPTAAPTVSTSAPPVDLTKQPGTSQPGVDPSTGWPGPDGAPRTTPPAWDPLGAAPFAWDLPEPTPLPDPSVRPARRTVLPQVTLGATLLVGAALAGGVFASWWALTWAQVSGLTLAVLAVGLLFSALRGGGRSLIGGGVFLSLVTLALAVTGISGTNGYGAIKLTPTALTQVQDSYSVNAGELDLDLRAIVVPRGTTKTVDVELKAGHALVHVPIEPSITAVCAADVGRTQCLDAESDGVRQRSAGDAAGGNDSGTLQVNVHVNAGFAEVVRGG